MLWSVLWELHTLVLLPTVRSICWQDILETPSPKHLGPIAAVMTAVIAAVMTAILTAIMTAVHSLGIRLPPVLEQLTFGLTETMARHARVREDIVETPSLEHLGPTAAVMATGHRRRR